MKANELRIGNHVIVEYSRSSYKDGVVTFISNDKIGVDHKNYKLINVKSIQLTEEWLLKFGFKPIGTSDDYSFKGIVIHTRKRGYIVNIKIPQLKYVHQLQNLVYASRGIELTIKTQ